MTRESSRQSTAKKNIPVNDPLLEDAFERSYPGEKKYRDNEYWRD